MEEQKKRSSGKMSRDKGKRVEYLVRDHLRVQGWKADRVPSSGAAQGFKGDIDAEHPKYGKKKFEVKARKDNFRKIYDLYDAHCRQMHDDVFAVAIPGAQHLCLTMSSSLEGVMQGVDLHVILDQHPMFKNFKRTFSKLINLEKLVGECDILVLKDDRKPLLFVRYR